MEVEAPALAGVTTLFGEHVAKVCYVLAALLRVGAVVNGLWTMEQDDDDEPDDSRHLTGHSIGAH